MGFWESLSALTLRLIFSQGWEHFKSLTLKEPLYLQGSWLLSFADTSKARLGATKLVRHLAKEGVAKQSGAKLLANIIA